MSILQVAHVSKSYGQCRAVDDVSLLVEQGDHWAIVGESGSGKTTLALIIMRLIPPDAGFIKSQAGCIQMVFQDPNQSLDPLWNIREILNEAFVQNRSLTKLEKMQKMEQMLGAVGLSAQVLGRFPHEFSGGERQRIAIARALLADPKILLLDEAVSALDTLVQKQIIDLLKKLKKDFDLTTIFISHNLRLVRGFSDKICVMYQGKIVEQGRAADVFKSPAHPYTRQLLQAAFLAKF